MSRSVLSQQSDSFTNASLDSSGQYVAENAALPSQHRHCVAVHDGVIRHPNAVAVLTKLREFCSFDGICVAGSLRTLLGVGCAFPLVLGASPEGAFALSRPLPRKLLKKFPPEGLGAAPAPPAGWPGAPCWAPGPCCMACCSARRVPSPRLVPRSQSNAVSDCAGALRYVSRGPPALLWRSGARRALCGPPSSKNDLAGSEAASNPKSAPR